MEDHTITLNTYQINIISQALKTQIEAWLKRADRYTEAEDEDAYLGALSVALNASNAYHYLQEAIA